MTTKTTDKTQPVKKKKAKTTAEKTTVGTEKKGPIDAAYNKFKDFHGQLYTGMKIGRSHKWKYGTGTWKETKITPDQWEFNYAVTKRRAGHAPEGSGAPVGTDYHWYILADQDALKLDANSYSIKMHGLKFKLAHKRADHENWSISEKGQKKKLIKILQKMIEHLEEELEEEKK
jgi:hypothetical protein